MKDKTKVFTKTEESSNIQRLQPSNSLSSTNTNFSEKSSNRFTKHQLMIIVGALLLTLGCVLLIFQSKGYMVYYQDANLGFVSEPEQVLDNISEINSKLSEKMSCEATVYADEFTFEKTYRVFKGKSDDNDLAQALLDNCSIDVNVYNVYVDGVYVAQDSNMERIEATIERLEKEYQQAHPDDNYDAFDFVQKLEIVISKGSEVWTSNDDEMYAAFNDNLNIKTLTKQVRQDAIPYEIVYETTAAKNCGEITVKSAGSDGLVEVVDLLERHDGVEVASTELKSTVLAESVDQVVLVGTSGMVVSDSGMASPSRGTVTSQMGYRWGRLHKGIDIAGSLDDPVYASKAGTVIVAKYNDNGYGNMVEIDHGNGLTTVYAHLNSIGVAVGDTVYLGQTVGLMGSTGNSTGVHLHFEVRIDGNPVNPLNYVNY